jgi:3-hydroxyacyl-CoA dehydrogenase/enoyl-CoA hydratase/3-hydroxybutyryl-CoA epimerase
MKPSYQHFQIDESLKDRIAIGIDVQDRSVNALSELVFDELQQILDSETQSDRHLPLVFRSLKRDSFVVGADLRRIQSIKTDAEIQQFLLRGQTVLERLERFPGATVAVIHGPCLGGGLEFALTCKFRLAVRSAKTQFSMPESKLGLMPGWGGTQRLPSTVGVSEGLDMLLTGRSVSADRACELYLVDAVFEEATFEEGVTTFLRRLTATQTADEIIKAHTVDKVSAVSALEQFDLAQYGALSAAQEAIYQAASIGIKQSVELGMKAERELFYPLLMSVEVQENLQKFLNRSKPC